MTAHVLDECDDLIDLLLGRQAGWRRAGSDEYRNTPDRNG